MNTNLFLVSPKHAGNTIFELESYTRKRYLTSFARIIEKLLEKTSIINFHKEQQSPNNFALRKKLYLQMTVSTFSVTEKVMIVMIKF